MRGGSMRIVGEYNLNAMYKIHGINKSILKDVTSANGTYFLHSSRGKSCTYCHHRKKKDELRRNNNYSR